MPRAPMRGRIAGGISCLRSASLMTGATSFWQNSRTIFCAARCSSVRVKSIAGPPGAAARSDPAYASCRGWSTRTLLLGRDELWPACALEPHRFHLHPHFVQHGRVQHALGHREQDLFFLVEMHIQQADDFLGILAQGG